MKYILVLLLIPLNFVFAKDCVDCTGKLSSEVVPNKKPMIELKKEIQAPLDMASNGDLIINSKASRAPAVVATSVPKKDDFQGAYCTAFTTCKNWVEVESLMEEMENSPFPESVREFWSSPSCYTPLKNNMPVPMIFNLAVDPVRGENWPKTIYEHFAEDKNDMETWLRIINTKTTEGYTFLDYMQYNIDRGYYRSPATIEPAKRVIAYVCKHGGIYSRYKDSAKCP